MIVSWWFLVVSSFCVASLLHTDCELLFTPRGVSSSDYLKNRLFPPSLSTKLEDRKTFRTIKFLRLLPSRQAEGIIGMCLVSVCVSPLDDYRWFKQVPVADPRFPGRGDAGLKLTLWNAQLLMFPAKLSLFLLWKTSSTEPGGKNTMGHVSRLHGSNMPQQKGRSIGVYCRKQQNK